MAVKWIVEDRSQCQPSVNDSDVLWRAHIFTCQFVYFIVTAFLLCHLFSAIQLSSIMFICLLFGGWDVFATIMGVFFSSVSKHSLQYLCLRATQWKANHTTSNACDQKIYLVVDYNVFCSQRLSIAAPQEQLPRTGRMVIVFPQLHFRVRGSELQH